jgi:predicted RNA-binding protein associated with RNAse of E/G family
VKRFPQGEQETYRCLALDVTPRLAVLLFPHPGERRAGGFLFPAGSRTYGFFWARRHYLLYVLHGPDGGLIAHRFDVVDEVRLRPGRVEYLDLALDVWVDPSGRAWTEDEDEVVELVSQALLSPQRLALIERTKRLLLARHRRIAAEAREELRRLGQIHVNVG